MKTLSQIMSGNSTKKPLFNTNLFYINGYPMKFYLEGYDEAEFHEYSKIIEAYGGKSSPPDGDTIIFSEPGRYADTNRRRFHMKCLRDSISQNKLQDINKYALPWKINERKEVTPNNTVLVDKKPNILENSIPQKISNKLTDSSMSKAFVVVQDCLMTHPKFIKEKKIQNVSRKEQSNLVSSSHENTNILPTRSKISHKTSPVASATKNRFTTLSGRIIPRITPSSSLKTEKKNVEKKVESKKDSLRSASCQEDDIVEFDAEIPKKSLIKPEIISISDNEDSTEPPEMKENVEVKREKVLQKPKVNLEGTEIDAPSMYAVWSSAGPPGPPLSESEDEAVDVKPKLPQLVRIKTEKVSKSRKNVRNITYFDSDSCSSEDGYEKKGKRRKRKKKSSYAHDPNFKAKI